MRAASGSGGSDHHSAGGSMPSAVSTRAATRWWPREFMCSRSSDQYDGGRQLAVGPVEGADDVGAIGDPRADRVREQVAATLDDAG